MCRSKSTVPHAVTSNYTMPSYKDVIISDFDSFCKGLCVNNIKRIFEYFSNSIQTFFKCLSNKFRMFFFLIIVDSNLKVYHP